MTKSSKDENFVQTFDFAGKTITLEDAEPLSDDEQDNFIEFKASEKIPEIHVEGDEDGPARYVQGFQKSESFKKKVNNAHSSCQGRVGKQTRLSVLVHLRLRRARQRLAVPLPLLQKWRRLVSLLFLRRNKKLFLCGN